MPKTLNKKNVERGGNELVRNSTEPPETESVFDDSQFVTETDTNHERVAQRAYELWERRGRPIGSPEADWHQAKKEIEAEEQTPG